VGYSKRGISDMLFGSIKAGEEFIDQSNDFRLLREVYFMQSEK
jgi:hypothetical protein